MAPKPPKIKIPDAIRKYIAKDASKDAKMIAAKAAVPMSPLIQVTVLTYLSGDSDTEVAEQAKNSLLEIPPSMLKNVLKGDIHPKALDFYARNMPSDQDLMETVLLNKLTPDETFVYLADKVTGKALDIIAGNQQRMLRTPDIANSFKKNPNAPKNIVERVVSFLRMSGIQVEGESIALTQTEINMLISEVEQKRSQFKSCGKTVAPQKEKTESKKPRGTMSQMEKDALSFEDDEEEYGDAGSFDESNFYADDLFNDKEEVSEDEAKGIAAKIEKMTVPQKVKIALMGNKEVRTILIKDSNKIVSSSVIKSPKITDNEVHSYAQMRSLNDEVIRYIASNKDWTKNYSIKQALVNNPKTPLPIGIKFMQFLNMKDVSDLSRNKNVSPQLQKLAKEKFNKMRGAS